ncbi:50S ribosomal protein L5 [Acidilobus sp.]|jgi:large subunit ribosomal protein L5|uniref:50S ribosomal protein L5 n=1 Tax=Acidilobus sp. TaxID=1872109 RepID=UPI003D087A3E
MSQQTALTDEVVNKVLSEWQKNPMRKPRIAKVTVNIALGSSGEKLVKVQGLLEQLTGQKPTLRKAKKTIRAFGIHRGENIAVAVTLRGQKAMDFLKRALEATGHRIKASSVDKFGNVCFGIPEYILLPGAKYDPEIGIVGMDVCLTVERPGFRVERRRRARSSIPLKHRVRPEETMVLLNKELGVTFV